MSYSITISGSKTLSEENRVYSGTSNSEFDAEIGQAHAVLKEAVQKLRALGHHVTTTGFQGRGL